MKGFVSLWATIFLLGISAQLNAAGKTYYVATQGSDANPGTLQLPWQNLKHALTLAQAGDTILMRGGEYVTNEVWIRGDKGMGGANGLYLTIRNYPGEKVSVGGERRIIVAADFVRIEGLHFRLPYRIGGGRNGGQVVNCTFEGPQPSYGAIEWSADNGLLEGNRIVITSGGDTKDHGIYLHAGHNNVVRKNFISGAAGYGIHAYDAVASGGPEAARGYRNVLIEENTVVQCQMRSGIILSPDKGLTSENVVIQKNVIAFNKQNGIRLRMNTSGVKILHNTLYGNGAQSQYVDDQCAISLRDGSVRNVTIQNNIIATPRNSSYHVQNREGASGIVVQRNLYWQGGKPKLAGVSDTQALYGDPLFNNAAAFDFTLKEKSPAINQGLHVGLPFEGAAPDLGAMEFGSQSSSVEGAFNTLPKRFDLLQNHPNPFNPATLIAYQIVSPAFITLRVYGLTGQLINTLVEEEQVSGFYSVQWSGNNALGEKVASGIYFYQLAASTQFAHTQSAVRKMTLLR